METKSLRGINSLPHPLLIVMVHLFTEQSRLYSPSDHRVHLFSFKFQLSFISNLKTRVEHVNISL